ncbi:MAG: NTP transferase domain-containing protein [Acidimicrobiales bacterium]|nr:NTP transferase domain-containing protein [Acidimicrobiales bacterium]
MSEPVLSAIVLAAGQGTRMRSSLPKPLHALCGKAMLHFVLDAVEQCGVDRTVVVVGHGAELMTKKLADRAGRQVLDVVEQRVQRGTGDAASVGMTAFPAEEADAEDADVVLLPGDTPLLRSETLAGLVAHHRETGAAATVLTARIEDPTGYGRVVRGRDGGLARIVEHADADADERRIDEINTGIYCFRRSLLAPALRRITPDNAQGEYYLTDVIEVLRSTGHPVAAWVAPDAEETAGVNDRVQLAAAEGVLRRRINAAWLAAGVTLVDPDHTYLDATVALDADVTIFPGAVLQGDTRIGTGVEIGPGCHLVDTSVGDGARLEQVVAHDAVVGEGARVGPFVVLHPGAAVAAGAVAGPFSAIGPDQVLGADDEGQNR